MKSVFSGMAENLEAYRAQRDQVAAVLAADPDAEGAESLRELLDSLNELISLSGGDNPVSDPSSLEQEETSAEPEAERDTVTEKPENVDEVDAPEWSAEEQELANSLLHMQCRVPFQHSWGQLIYSSAMVQSMESSPLSDDVEEVHVRVLFLQPTHRKMMTCPYFLDGRCRFPADECRFSHGEVYPLSSLKPYEPPDFSSLAVGNQILCRNSEGIWERGVVTELHQSDGDSSAEPQITVKIKRKKRTGIARNRPKLMEKLSDLDDEEEFIPHSAWDQSVQQVGSGFGEWEAHTKGVASKIMARMGFVVGTGLGSRAEGRIEPVIAQVYPQGRTLDYCMDLREQKELPKVGEKLRKVNKRKNAQQKQNPSPKADVFSVINEQMKLHRRNTTPHADTQPVDKNSNKIKNAKEQNVELMKLQDKISALEKELVRLRTSFSRNQTTDKKAASMIAEKISGKEQELMLLRRKQNTIFQDLNKQKDRKSLSVF
ncbi:zinc finger CCCH-type with G patch domain-containing protein-like [Paramacrobiotus metropolitanus]|uniref:zinc finger CCCH-type with G patch domain-containing protein-like n=1 Tax=Paramacrobiotus metropolitanus TaxID=2943436 RepID=UPI0024462426|nr:zinc finger CCCH-type with G patch domain-containing protein-like [Paramacrobiotus metropolitanus]